MYFSFVWRPRAVRHGLMAPLQTEANLKATTTEDDPKILAEILRSYIKEVDHVIGELEETKDRTLVRAYLKFFFRMFSGIGVDSSAPTMMASQTQNKIRELQQKMQVGSKDAEAQPATPPGLDDSSASEQQSETEKESYSALHDRLFLEENQGSKRALRNLAQSLGDNDDQPPPLPPPLPGPTSKKTTPILAVNFDSISMNQIEGTVWEEMTSFELPPAARQQLTEELKRSFGGAARSRAKRAPEEVKSFVGTLNMDPNRMRNVEVLLHMSELKDLGSDVDRLIQAFKRADPRLFNASVLERLIRSTGTGESRALSILPSRVEVAQLEQFRAYCTAQKIEPEKLLLGRTAELLFYRLFAEVPDREERVHFCFFIEKFDRDKSQNEKDARLIVDAVEAVMNSSAFKKVLRVVFEILNVLNPKHGASRGFRLSTLISKIDRIVGKKSAPASEGSKEPKRDRARAITKGTGGTKKAAQRGLLDSSEGLSLFEFLADYLKRFPECALFWQDVQLCQTAQMVDILSLEQQSTVWLSKLHEIKQFVKSKHNDASGEFRQRLDEFLARSNEIEELRSQMTTAKARVEALWSWMGESIDAEPQAIFRHIAHFSQSFEIFYEKNSQ